MSKIYEGKTVEEMSYIEYLHYMTDTGIAETEEAKKIFCQKSDKNTVDCMMRNHMMQVLKDAGLETQLEVYSLVASVLNLKTRAEIEAEWEREKKENHLKSLIEKRKALKKMFKEDSKLVTKVEIITLTEKITTLRAELKGE